MLNRCVIVTGLIATLSFSLGCGKMTTLEKNWGESFESEKYNQIANPEAQENLEPVVGLDGVAAERNMEKYRGGFKEQPREEVYNLRLGTISGIGESRSK